MRVGLGGRRRHVMCMQSIIEEILKKYGLTVVTTGLLVGYHLSEERRWTTNQADSMMQWMKSQDDLMERWKETLQQSQDRSDAQLRLVSACCQAHAGR